MAKQKRCRKKKQPPRNKDQYAQLASEYIIPATPVLDDISAQAHNLYNRALYDVRHGFFKHEYVDFGKLNTMFKNRCNAKENMLYRKMGYVQSAQQTLREVMNVWFAWISALKAYQTEPSKFSGRPKMPKYLHRKQRHTFYVTNQNAKIVRRDKNDKDFLVINKLGIKVKLASSQIEKIGRIVIKPLAHGYKLIVPYKTNKKIEYLPDNGRYIGIDPGVDNAFACVSNTGAQPLLVNGRAVKSVNQYYNKKRSQLKILQAQYHQKEKMISTKQSSKPVYQETQAMMRITDWRNAKIRQFAHKASKCIVDYALSCDANTIVIGKNKSWKRSSDMGKRNNQNFIGIPHQAMINLIKYKANLNGITVIQTNESYTSQTSALDHEKPCWNNGNKSRKSQGKNPINRRLERGLFRANDGTLINADVNGALQIIKKVFPNFALDNGIAGAVLRPIKWSPTI
ncbi:RNA-guided endonuclease InsQ/TnpB family protein [Lactobacillus amylolyticus]|jgi:putative transposase|uniref:RNA-guided endonuclease InsQ/TnpB family protein n=1 Tax=Lactobacillus amylolyticus TaxID=83683 RepID=UPI0024900031|nr:transposase [Lactobacillus amylolyticus]